MKLIYLALLCSLIVTSFLRKSEARLHAESIVGGTAAAVNENTYAVSIQIRHATQAIYWHLCGGAILNDRYIITAAHCFVDTETNRFENKEYMVVAGVTKAHNREQYREARDVAKIYIPREYNLLIVSNTGVRNRRFGADIAVLELKSELGLNPFISHVILPRNVRAHLTYENQQAVVCGYGHNWITMRHDEQTHKAMEVETGSDSYERRFAVVNIISNTACQHFFRDIMDNQFCSHMRQRIPNSPEGLCMGDSGAPLVIGNNTIIGVVSSSPKGCREDVEPAIYTRVTSFIPFIINAMNGVQTATMRLAKYKAVSFGRGRSSIKKVLVEQ